MIDIVVCIFNAVLSLFKLNLITGTLTVDNHEPFFLVVSAVFLGRKSQQPPKTSPHHDCVENRHNGPVLIYMFH